MTFKKRTVPGELEGCCTPMPGQQTLYNPLISNEEICQSTRVKPSFHPQRRKPMDDKIIAIFCLCDDLLKAMHHQEDRQCQMHDAEIMTTAFIAALFFRGNHESARTMLKQH